MKDFDQEDVEKINNKESMIYVSLYAVIFVIIALLLSADKLQTLFEVVVLLAIMFILMIIYSVIDNL